MQSGVFPFGEKQGGRYSMPQQQGWTTTNYRKEQDAQQQGNEYPFSKEQGARFPFGKEQGYQRQWPQWSLPFAEEEGVKLQLAQQPNWIASLFSKGQGYQRQWSKEQGKRVPFAKEEGIKLQPPQQQNWIIRTPFSEEQGKKLKQYADEQGTSSPFDWLLPSAYNSKLIMSMNLMKL